MENFSSNPQMVEPQNPDMWNTTWFRVLSIIIVAGLVIFLGAWFWTKQRGAKLVTAPAGQVVDSFPKELIGETGVYISQSYARSTNGVNQPTVTYISNKSLADNISLYKNLLQANGWQIYTVPDPLKTVSAFYAKKGSAELNVTFDASDKKAVTVTESYLGGS